MEYLSGVIFKLFLADGSKYVGEWNQGKQHGTGIV